MTVATVTAERGSDSDLVAAIQELQRLKVTVVAGAAAVTDIAVAGILTTDTLVAVLHEDGTSGVTQSNLVSEASITSAGNIQLATTATTGDKLVVYWFDKAA